MTRSSSGKAACCAVRTSYIAAEQRQRVAHGASRGNRALHLKPQRGETSSHATKPNFALPDDADLPASVASPTSIHISQSSAQHQNFQTNPIYLEYKLIVYYLYVVTCESILTRVNLGSFGFVSLRACLAWRQFSFPVPIAAGLPAFLLARLRAIPSIRCN
jgi:hypothetical protein